MREYHDGIHFICLEAQTLAMKQSSSKVLFITQLGHRQIFRNNSINSRHLFMMIKHVLRVFDHNYVES